MTTHRMQLALTAAVLLTAVACQQASNNPPANSASSSAAAPTPAPTPAPPPAGGGGNPPQTITVGLHYDEDANGVCLGALGSQSQYSAKVRRGWKIHWDIMNDCATFDYTKACVELSSTDKVLAGGPHQCGKANTRAIDAVVSTVPGDAPDNSIHLYSIRYNTRAGGDPEIDVICDTCDEN